MFFFNFFIIIIIIIFIIIIFEFLLVTRGVHNYQRFVMILRGCFSLTKDLLERSSHQRCSI